MKNNKKKIAVSVVAAILLVLLYLLIFAFSGQDGEKSGSLSSMISEKCAELLNAISGKHWTQNVIDSMAAYFEHPIRKLAHFSEYACMGVLLYGVWRPWKERTRKLYLLIVLWVFVSALVLCFVPSAESYPVYLKMSMLPSFYPHGSGHIPL